MEAETPKRTQLNLFGENHGFAIPVVDLLSFFWQVVNGRTHKATL
jgi:hypothetical protein